MTALRGTPSDFGYAPAREARRASEEAFERGVIASCSLMALLFVASFLLRGLAPIDVPEIPLPEGPRHDVLPFTVEHPAPPPPGGATRPSPAPGVPLPVPDVNEPPAIDPAPPSAGNPTGLPGLSEPVRPGPIGEPDPVPPAPGTVVVVDVLPEPAVRVLPEYPEMAREAQVEGTVYLWALVGRDGAVQDVRVIRSVPLLDRAAADALRRWRFTPALTNGKPVRVWVAVPVRFSLH
jgi:protein TonB